MKNKIFLFPLSLAVVLFASIIIIFSPLGSKTIINVPTPTPTPTDIPWQTYRNNQYGFEFQYPSEMNIVLNPYQEKRLVILITNDTTETVSPGGWAGVFISVIPNSTNIKVQTYVENEIANNPYKSNTTIKKITTTDINGVVVDGEITGGNRDTTPMIYISKGKYIIKIDPNLQSFVDLSNQILSTFKFTQ